MILPILFWLTAVIWLVVVVSSAAGVARLPSLTALKLPVDRPSVSVIIPVRDEAKSIETTAGRLRQQQDVDLEIIFVDDRSVDESGAILDRLSKDDPNIRVIHIEHLPEGDGSASATRCMSGRGKPAVNGSCSWMATRDSRPTRCARPTAIGPEPGSARSILFVPTR